MGEVSKINNYTDFFYHAFRNILIIGIPLVIIFALVLSLPHSSAEVSGSTDNVQLTLSTSCTVNAVVTSEHTVSLNGGQLDNNVGNTKLSAFCNDNNGYSIYAVGSSGDIDGNTDLINTVNESYNIHTGVYNGNNASNPSSWAMKLTAGTGTGIDPTTGGSVPTTPPTIINGYDNYSAIPNVYTQVAKRTSGTSMTTDTSVSGSYLDTTYQIYANSAQPAGTYNGKVKYVIIHPSSSNNTISDIDAAFASAGKQKVYQDSEGSYYAMQDMTSEICNMVVNTGEGTTARLVDTRDKNIYYVTKEKDNNCWMTQNLDLKLNDPNTTPLTSENTDISDDPTVYTATPYATGYTVNNGVYTWAPNNATSDATVDYVNNAIDGAWIYSGTNPASAEGGDTYIYTNGVTGNTIDDRYDLLKNCTEAGHTATDCRHYHVGNYYNYTAAIASNNSTNFNTQYNNAANSICPKGWRLPIATDANNESREFGDLLVAQGIMSSTTTTSYATNGFVNIRKAPLWFVRSGGILKNQLINTTVGHYQSSTVYNELSTYFLHIAPSRVSPSTYDSNTSGVSRYFGGSIRCLARRTGE